MTGNPRSALSSELATLLGRQATAYSMVLLGMGRDVPDGNMRLREGWLDVDWTTRTSLPYFRRVRDEMAGLASAMGGRLRLTPLWDPIHWFRRVITVHPLGGCPMGVNPNEGVVDSHGEVFGYPGLFVADGSVMPGPVGANPSLTIAALADRFAERYRPQAAGAARASKRALILAGGGMKVVVPGRRAAGVARRGRHRLRPRRRRLRRHPQPGQWCQGRTGTEIADAWRTMRPIPAIQPDWLSWLQLPLARGLFKLDRFRHRGPARWGLDWSAIRSSDRMRPSTSGRLTATSRSRSRTPR